MGRDSSFATHKIHYIFINIPAVDFGNNEGIAIQVAETAHFTRFIYSVRFETQLKFKGKETKTTTKLSHHNISREKKYSNACEMIKMYAFAYLLLAIPTIFVLCLVDL